MARQIIRQERFIVNSFKNASTLIEQKLLCKSIAKTDAETVNAYNELKESVIQSIANISDEWTNVKDKELVVTAAGKELIVSEWHYTNIVVTITSDARNTNSVIFDDTYLITRSDFEAPIEVKAAVKYDTEVGPQIFVTARIVLNRYDVATGELVDTVINHVPADGILYFNNGNAPVMEDYDFVMMDGIRYEDAREGGTFSVWYVQHSVADPTATTLSAIGTVTTNNDVKNTYSLELTNSTSLVSTSGRNTLTEPKRINTSNLIDASALFKYGYYITSIPDLDTSNVTNMREMFFHCDRLQEIPYMDTSSVINMQNIFAYTSLLQGPTIDTSSVTNASYMFYNCGSLTDIPVYDFSNVTNLQYAFSGCTSLTSIPNISDAVSATNLQYIFQNTGITTLENYVCNLSANSSYMFDGNTHLTTVNNVTVNGDNVTRLFNNCTALTTVKNLDLRDATNADYLFGGDTELVEIDGIDVGNVTSGLWLNLGTTSTKLQTVKNVDAHSATSITVNSYCGSRSITNVADWDVSGMTTAGSMFSGCTSLVSCTGFLWPDAAISTSNMLSNCTNLTTAEISGIQSSNAAYMFYGCCSLESIPNIDYSNLTNIEHIFENCTGLTNAITISLDSVTTGNSAFNGVTVPLTISNLDSYTNSYSLINDYNGPSLVVNSAAKLAASNATTTPTSTSGYYYGLCLSKRVRQNDTNALRTVEIYNTPLLTNATRMFSYRNGLESVTMPDAPVLSNTDYMFAGCSSLVDVDLSSTTNITNAACMFEGCTSLVDIDLSNITNITTANSMFMNCSNLQDVTFSSTITLVNASSMFENCTSLSTIPAINRDYISYATRMFYNTNLSTVDSYTITNVASTDASSTFESCNALTTVTNLDASNIDSANRILANCSNLTTASINNLDTCASVCGMFANDGNLESIVLDGLDLSATVTNSSDTGMFPGCTALTSVVFTDCKASGDSLNAITTNTPANCTITIKDSLELNKFPGLYSGGNTTYVIDNVPNINNLDYLFGSNTGDITGYPIITGINMSNITSMVETFAKCSSLVNSTNFPSWVTLGGTDLNITGMFLDCTNLTELPASLCDWSNVKTARNTFWGCSGLKSVHITDASNLQTVYAPFANSGVETVIIDNCTLFNNPTTNRLFHRNIQLRSNVFSGYTNETYSKKYIAPSTANISFVPAIKSVQVSGLSSLVDARHMFIGCSNLESVVLTGDNITTANYMFYNCSKLTSVTMDSTKITSATYMFYGCTSLTEISDIYFAEGATFSYAFTSCTALTSVTFNTQTSVAGSHVFNNCTSLTTIVSPNNTLTFNGTYTFYGCKSLVDLSDLAITVSNPVAMFAGCTALEHLGDMNFTAERLNTQTHYNRSGRGNSAGLDIDVFYNCTKIKSFGNITITNTAYDFLPTISYFKSTLESIGNIISDGWGGTTPSSFFSSCTALRTVGDISCANFTTLSSLFAGCTALESVGNITATAATQFSNMFKNCSSLTQVGVITVNAISPNANATYAADYFKDMFTGCSSLTEVTIANMQNTTVEETLIANFPNITFTFI